MKKIFALALAVVSSLSMFAVINSQLTIYLNSESKEVEARVASGDTYSPFNAAACAAFVPMYSNASNIGLYVKYNSSNYQELNAPELVNVPLVVVSSREAANKQNYKFFAELGANNPQSTFLTDLRPDGGGDPVTILLNNSTEYSFSLNSEAAYVEGENSVISDRFLINYDSNFEICFIDNVLQIHTNPYPDDAIVIKDANGDHVAGSPFAATAVPQNISLDALAAGNYTVQFGGGAKNFIVVVKH